MAELKPLKITIEGVDKVLKSTQQIQKELNEVKRLAREKNNITLNDSQAREVLRNLKKQAQDAEASLQSIDKNVKFSNFKAAMKSISSELVNIAAVAATSGKSASENINAVGGSIAGIVSNFGFIGAAAGAAITLITPFVASLFEASEAEKAVASATEEYSKEVAKNTVVVNDSFETLKDNTSTYIEKKEAIDELQKILPGYLDELNAEGTSLERLNELQKISLTLVRKLALEKIFAGKIAEQQAKRLEAEIKAESRFAKIKRDRIADGKTEAEADAIVSRVRLQGGTVAYEEYLDVVEETTDAISNLEAAQKSLNDQLEKSLTPEEAAALEKIQKGADSRARASSGGGAKPFKPVELFGENYQQQLTEFQDLLNEGKLSTEDFEKAYSKLRFSRDKYLSTLAKDEKKAAELLKERAAIEAEIVKLDQEFQTTGLFAINFQEGTANAAGLTGQAFKDALAQVRQIAGEAQQGLITSQEAIEKFRALSFANQSKGLQDLFKKYDSTYTQIEQKSKTLTSVQQKINDESNATFIREKVKTDKELQNIESQKITILQNQAKRAAEAQVKADDESAKNAILSFDAQLAKFKVAYDKSVEEFKVTNDLLYNDILGSNNTFKKDIFTKTAEGFIEVNELAVIDLATTLSKEEQALLDQRLKASENLNRQLYNKQVEYDRERKELAENFIKDNNIILKKFQSSEIEENLKRNNRTIEDNRYYQMLNIDDLKTIVEERKKLGNKQTKEEVAFIQTRLEQQLQLEEDSYKLRLESETKFDKERLSRLKALAGTSPEAIAEVTKLEEDITRRSLVLQRENGEARTKIVREFNGLIEENTDKSSKKVAEAYSKSVQTIVKDLQGFGNAFVDFLNQQSQNFIDSLTEDLTILEAKQADVLSNIARLEDDLEGKRSGRRDAVLQALEQQRSLEEQVAKDKLALMERIEKEEIKMRKRQQAASIANAVINGALAITNILAQPSIIPEPANSIFKAVQIGLSVGTTAAQVATIASQKFAKGGFTGAGSERDETGHKVAGVVHNDEWVAPKWMVESPKFGGMINQLENARTKGFAQGGFTSPDFNSLSQSVSGNSTAKLESMMRSYMETNIQLANRPLFVSATEVQNVNTTSSRRKASVTL